MMSPQSYSGTERRDIIFDTAGKAHFHETRAVLKDGKHRISRCEAAGAQRRSLAVV